MPFEVLPLVSVLATGGTIAGVQAGGLGYTSGTKDIASLLSAVPGVERLARLESEQVCALGSQDMDDEHWLLLLSRVRAALARPELRGVIVTHGTDTMEETAYFLNLVLDTDKPVVLVGAMRPATSISADGPMNLYNAVAVCCDEKAEGRGVLLVANDEIHFARAVAKTNTTQVGTFRSMNHGLAGLAQQGKIHWFAASAHKHTRSSTFAGFERSVLPRVEIIHAHAGMDAVMVRAAVAAGARGVIIAGVGSGNLHHRARAACREAIKEGIVFVRASRTGEGLVGRNMEINDDAEGFIVAGDLNPQKSRILLQLALASGTALEAIQALFESH